jgi:MerR family transcriptional regulator, light-induced transcriptional regulator
MHHFTIRDIENLSGIKAHTLRMWEQRYGLCVCKRKESKHRYYDNDDLRHILRIAYLYHQNYKISRIAQLSQKEIIQLSSRRNESDEYEPTVNQFIEASLDYDQHQFEMVFNGLLRTMGLEKSVEKVIYPFLDKIGLLWMTGHVLPAQEHFCSYLIQKTIIAAINALPTVINSENRFILFTPEGEGHELTLLFVQYLIKKKGIKTILLGKNVSMDIVKEYCTNQPASHLYFHLVTNFTNCAPEQYLSKLSAAFADKKIIASGPAFKGVQNIPGNVELIRSLQHVISFDFSA